MSLLFHQDGRLTQVPRPNPPNFGSGFVSKFSKKIICISGISFEGLLGSQIYFCYPIPAGPLTKTPIFFQTMLKGHSMKSGCRRLSNYFKCSRSFWRRRLEHTGSQRKLYLPNRERQRSQGESSPRRMLSSSSMSQSSRA